MGHTKFEDLLDIKSELSKIRELPGIREKSPGVFYFKSIPFLHFHDKDGKRWADIKEGKSWTRFEIPFDPKKSQKLEFLKIIRQLHLKASGV
ncbi:MAG: hypothetical protein KDD25_05945 [Bdellovibrionales bacterium]|nr:hypothetical protein [Bdellovibrionales bacterium]